jgi:hypothetical protein
LSSGEERAERLAQSFAFCDARCATSFNKRPVSSAMPNRPGPSASSTSSDVPPDNAISKSWIIPAPFIARAET